jgi:hypothetical protein
MEHQGQDVRLVLNHENPLSTLFQHGWPPLARHRQAHGLSVATKRRQLFDRVHSMGWAR